MSFLRDRFMAMQLGKLSEIKKLTWLYISTAVVVSGLMVGGQVLTQRSLQNQSEDARVINVAGRQRMLSQKIAKASYAVASEDTQQLRARAETELNTSLEQFATAHKNLQFGGAELGLSGTNSPVISAFFADLEADYQTLTEAARARQAEVISEQIQALLPSLAAVNQGIETQSSSASQIRDAMEQLSAENDQTVQALQETNTALDQLQGVAARLQAQQVVA